MLSFKYMIDNLSLYITSLKCCHYVTLQKTQRIEIKTPHKMDLKEMIVRIRLLGNDVLDFSMGSYFGIQADNKDVKKLWQDYDDLRNQINGNFSGLSNELLEVPLPDPILPTVTVFIRRVLLFLNLNTLPVSVWL
jgi:hypothetical protein